MSRCPVEGCKGHREKPWHLVCPSCWAKVPKALQDRVYSLWRTRNGSAEHRRLCLSIIGDLSCGDTPDGE